MKNPRRKILIIDGHEEILIALERLLEDNGFSTVTAWSAKEAFEKIKSVTFDLALLNEYLPDADAEDVLRRLSVMRVAPPCMVMHPGAPDIMEASKFCTLGAVGVASKSSHPALLQAMHHFFDNAIDSSPKTQGRRTEGKNYEHSSHVQSGSRYSSR